LSDFGKRRNLYWLLLIVSVIISFLFFSREIVVFWLNLHEFGDFFIKSIYFSLLGGFILATLALFRVDFKNRRSITWWFNRLIFRLVRSGSLEKVSPAWFDFDSFKLSPLKFLAWQ